MEKTKNEWKNELTENEYHVLREKGTEKPFSGKYNLHFEKGIYSCKGCGEEIFSSTMKYESSCGWPSFNNELPGKKISKIKDERHGMIRTEIVCNNCKSHLGHLFNNEPSDTGLRYCVNSISLDFKKLNV